MLARILTLVAGVWIGALMGCDGLVVVDEQATTESALLVLDDASDVVSARVEIGRFVPSEALVKLHWTVENKVFMLAEYAPLPGPCPDPATVRITVNGRLLELALEPFGPKYLELCTAERPCDPSVSVTAERTDSRGGTVTLEVVPAE